MSHNDTGIAKFSDTEARAHMDEWVMSINKDSSVNEKVISHTYFKIGDKHAVRFRINSDWGGEQSVTDEVHVFFEGSYTVLTYKYTITEYAASYKSIETTLNSVALAGAVAKPSGSTPAQSVGETMGQRNAVRSAKQYLDYSAFSRQGLIKQLEYEGYSNADAIYGVDRSGADWMAQAVKSAQQYLNYSAFSRQGLIKQLEYEGFTYEQAIHGVGATGL
jgi:hypothetical protein